MTAAHDHEYMHHVVDQLTGPQVRRLRLLVTQDAELSQAIDHIDTQHRDEAVPPGLLALIGSIDGPTDLAERHDDHIRDRMRQRFGDQE